MGGKKKQTTGYQYFLGMHAAMCHGPVDYLLRIQFDDKDAWTGQISSGGAVIHQTSLFGGDDLGGQGGVEGAVELLMGAPDQGQNAYLQAQLGTDIPAFRGITSLVFNGGGTDGHGDHGYAFYFGMSPYLKKFNARFQRVHKTTDGATQWYDAKSAILNSQFLTTSSVSVWKYKVVERSDVNDYSAVDYDDSAWLSGVAPFASFLDLGNSYWTNISAYGFKTTPGTDVPQAKSVWMRGDINIPRARGQLKFQAYVDNGIQVWVNGTKVIDDYGYYGHYYETTLPDSTFLEGVNHIAVRGMDDTNTGSGAWFYFDFRVIDTGALFDMNPAHIIRECLTDGDWGMGYLAADIDDDSFKAAADTLYLEGMGMSLLWDKGIKIEDFVKDVCRHVNATLYVSRRTGKFVLKLIRDDYVLDDLLELHPGQVEKIEKYACQTDEELVNSVTVQFWNSETNQQGSVTERDTALIQQQGAEINTTVQYQGFTNIDTANRVALRDLVTLSTPLTSCDVTADRTAKDLDIGDPFKLFWPDYFEGYKVMRVVKMGLGNGRKNSVILTVAQDQFALPTQGTSSGSGSGSDWVDPIGPPTAPSIRIAVEAPYYELIQRDTQSTIDQQLSDEPLAGYVVASAAKASASSINMNLEVDGGAGYEYKGISDFSPCCTLAADMPREIGPTTIEVIPGSDFTRMSTGVHAQIEDELVRIDAIDTTANTITVARGVLDTVPEKHLTDNVVISWDEYAAMDETQYLSGESINVKLVAKSGSAQVDIGSTPVDTVVMNQRAIRPYPPGQVKLNGTAYPASISGALTVTWKHRNRVSQADQLVDNSMGDVTPAPNNRYGLRFLDSDSTLLIERIGIGPGTAAVVLDYTGDVTMELWTIDNNGESWQKHSITFAYTPPSGSVVSSITATNYTPTYDGIIVDGGA